MRYIIVKKRDKKKNIIGMHFLRSNSQDIAIVKVTDDEPPLHSFFLTSEDFGEYQDSYVQVSEKMVTVYNKNMKKINLRVEGLNIRNSVDVNQSYVYTLSDRIETAFRVFDGSEDDEGHT